MMQLHSRKVLLISIIGIILLGLFLILRFVSISGITKANTNLAPEYCIPVELQAINAELSKDSGAANELLIEKKTALEKSMKECAALAASLPPAEKPSNLISVMQPTPSPLPTAQIIPGIQKMVSLPSGNFIPTGEAQNNYWAGVIKGQTIQILAGILRDQDESWREDHPEWTNAGPQGAVEILDANWSIVAIVQTPTRNGYIQFVKECDSLLLLQAEDGTMFVFDPANLTFTSNDLQNYSSSHGCR